MQLMGIDYGEKRIGVASTDESGQFALPRKVLDNRDGVIDEIVALKKEWKIEKIILGESKNLDGKPNPISEDINKFKSVLEEKGIEVVLHPEVFTSQEAERLQGKNELLDASAAALILKSYIDTTNNS